MKAPLKAIVPALALAAALALPSLAEAGHRHGRGCGHKGYGRSSSYYYDDGYGGYGSRGYGGRGHGGGYYARPYGYAYGSPYRPYARRYYAPPPYAYGYGGYGYYPPPPPPAYYGGRPRVGVSLYFGF